MVEGEGMARFQDVLGYFRRYWPLSIFSIATTSAFEIVDLMVPYAIGQILNVLSGQPLDPPVQTAIAVASEITGFPTNQSFSLAVLLGVIFLVTVVKAPLQPWLSSWFHWDIALRARRDQMQTVLAKILTLPLDFYDEHNPGRIAARIAKGIENHTWTYPEIAGQLIPKLFRVVGIVGVIWLIDWRIGLLFLVSFLLILALDLRGLGRLIQREQVLDHYMENTQSRNSEIITNIKTVKAFATEALELKRQNQRVNREFQVVDHRIHKGYVQLQTLDKTIVQCSAFLVLGLTLAATIEGQISLGHFITTLTVSSMAYAELEPITLLSEVFARRYASMLRFHEFMQQPVGVDGATLTPAPVPQYQFTGKLEFVHLTFSYDRGRPVLQDINLLIEPYQTVAFVGRSGSGKSTLVKLLLRYFEPDRGAIFMDGQDIRQLAITGYRRRLAIVHQEVDIFNGTLLENLVYGNPQASFDQVEAACRIAQADGFIAELPEGYFTVVGERGVRLSGGQRQRIGIARALIVEPDVLIFDEATSSLDYESERSIQLAMGSILGTRTTLVIAHRLSTVREADKIVVLDQGRIVEVGSHGELLHHQGIYHRLHALQETGELLP